MKQRLGLTAQALLSCLVYRYNHFWFIRFKINGGRVRAARRYSNYRATLKEGAFVPRRSAGIISVSLPTRAAGNVLAGQCYL